LGFRYHMPLPKPVFHQIKGVSLRIRARVEQLLHAHAEKVKSVARQV
jgi:hypothetical protein